MLSLKQWLEENHPSVLERWEESFADLVDLDLYIEEYWGVIDQEFQNYLERESDSEMDAEDNTAT